MLLHTSAERERRLFAAIGAAGLLCCVAGAAIFMVHPFGRHGQDCISLTIDASYAAPGVATGTPLILHGVEVGQVTAVSVLPGGGVRLKADLQKTPVAELTDAINIDFRPANYFGVTGINVMPNSGGKALRDGMSINTVPKGNFTLPTLLSRLGELSNNVITPQLIQVIDRASRYGDALDPLIETLLISAHALAEVQTVRTARLLANTTGLSVVFPSVLNAVTDTGDAITHGDMNWIHEGIGDLSPDQWYNKFGIPTLDATSKGIFGSLGKLEGSHVADLLPLVTGIRVLTDTVPPLLRPVGVAQMLIELRSRFERLYGGTPEQRAVKARIVLDSLPGVAAPLGIGGP